MFPVLAPARVQNHHLNSKICLQLQKISSLHSTFRWLASEPQGCSHWHLPLGAGPRPRVKTSPRTVLSGHSLIHAQGPTLSVQFCSLENWSNSLAEEFKGILAQWPKSQVLIGWGNHPQRKSVVSRVIALQSRSHHHTHPSPWDLRNPWSREWIISLGGFAEEKLPVGGSRKI